MAIGPDTVHGEQEQDLGEGDHVDGGERISPMALYRWENRPRGGGADGKGGGGDGSPRPCLDVSLKTSLAGNTPTSLLLPGYHLPG